MRCFDCRKILEQAYSLKKFNIRAKRCSECHLRYIQQTVFQLSQHLVDFADEHGIALQNYWREIAR